MALLRIDVDQQPRKDIGRTLIPMNQRRLKFSPLYDDELALPDLAQWVAFYGGYDQIPAWAWVEWDRWYEQRQRMQKLSGLTSPKGRTTAPAIDDRFLPERR